MFLNDTPASQSDTAYADLREAILVGRLAPDSLWSDRELGARMGYGRTPIREALLRLQTEGLVQILARKGTRILPLLKKDVQDIHQLTKALELEAALTVAKRDDRVELLAPVLQAVERMESAIAVEDRERWVVADTDFHFGVVDICGNPRLIGLYHAQRGLTDRARFFALWLRELPVRSTQEHREMYDRLVAADAPRLEALYRNHWERTTNELLALIERQERGRGALGASVPGAPPKGGEREISREDTR
ncbi:GntR family transcriptional regulator [Wenxinia marina]|uniref:Transcriptional regulator, GntR family n=1 Tax=Wenxinia marina DSM 24838 TaxID=1123501 RepID=A0A0D0PC36_9RHOB|nr:GntR family transcriptional regulator [Wenxinia marina]KIQ69021.1 transcriptional regulator, GntR family [Wenxinia marina DSM 24838]GGL81206.1 GntR family transcriptional regulator [Wenxinia marina]